MNRTAQECIRPRTVRLACRLLSPLLDAGTITTSEYAIIRKTLSQLLKSGEPLQVIKPKLLTPQEAAEILAISYSQFRNLEREGVFPFHRKCVGNKTVRYRNIDIFDYVNYSDTTEKQTEGEQ